jgi:hypothetical protein
MALDLQGLEIQLFDLKDKAENSEVRELAALVMELACLTREAINRRCNGTSEQRGP